MRNEPGSLHRVLAVLGGRGINLSKLESRPDPGRAWEYVFWVDLDGDLCAPDAARVLSEIQENAVRVRLFGCYPVDADTGDDTVTS